MTMTDVLSRLVDTTAFHLQKDAFWLDIGLERRLDIDAKTIDWMQERSVGWILIQMVPQTLSVIMQQRSFRDCEFDWLSVESRNMK